MNKTNFSKIIDLFKNKKVAEAKKELAGYLSEAELNNQDVGQVYAEIAATYLKANNYLLRGYNEFLKELIGELRVLKAK